MLILGYVFAIRSERALCREVQVNLAYRWFCGLGIEDGIPDHSAFTRARNERFRDHDVFRHVFEHSGKILPRSSGARGPRGDDAISYFSRVVDCRDSLLKSKCCPSSPSRKITRHVHEKARDAARAIAKTAAYQQTRRDRKKVEMLFAHLKRILRLGRLRLRGPAGAQFEFMLAAIAQNLRRLAKLALHPPDTAVPRIA